jgi:murein DD-endopeptidase MepM/ murein hydrolase activator NlpD
MAAICLALAGCGSMVAPSFSSPSETASAPANPNMGQVINGAYIVAPGDTLASVSDRTNTPIRALIDSNGLQPPYNIRPGQELRIAERQNYVVKAGDTLGGLAQRFNVQQSALVELNGLKAPYKLRVGQSLVLPSAVEASQSVATALPSSTTPQIPAPKVDVVPAAANSGTVSGTALPPAVPTGPAQSSPVGAKPIVSTTVGGALPPASTTPSTPPAATAKAMPAEPDLSAAEEAAEGAYEKKTQQQVAAAPAATAPAPAPAPVPAAAKPVESAPVAAVGPARASGFSWPVHGKVILKYGATTDGLRNDGINIAAPAGAPVMASADGTVAYAGNQLRGFGNLVLIRHANGLITAYAHNQSLLVQKGDKVKRGAIIARVGSTGNVPTSQLHFEIRKGEEPVDPMKYLGG